MIIILPLAFVFCGSLFKDGLDVSPRLKVLSGFLAAYLMISILSYHPHYIAYFNEFVGPDNGYKYLLDSNLDWGQDLKGLSLYMNENSIDNIKLSYFGTAMPEYYEINYEQLDCEPTTGMIAISASNLQGLPPSIRNCFVWLRAHEPIHKIGYSIFIYNITA